MVHTLRLDNYYPTPRKLVLGTNSSFGTESIKIERGAGWDGLNLTATWHIPGREEPLRVALLDGDAMDVPPEVTKEAKDGVLVLAGLASSVQRASCNVEYLILEQAGVYGGADAEPTPELAAQVLEAALQAKADAEAAAEDAAAAKANADKAQSDAEKAQQAAENAAADAAKAGPHAEAALAAQKAAESARDEANAAQQATENAAAAAAASKSAADTLAAEAARAALAAENSKAAANNAADLAGENATAAQQAAATAIAAANDAGHIASDAAASKAAAETAAKAAQDAQTAAAAAKAEAVKAQRAAQTAAKSAQDAQAAAVAAQKDAAASKTAAANSAIAAKTSEDAAAKSAADADSTANSINESMTQIAANKEAVSRLKEDTAALQKRQNVLVGSETGNTISCNDAFAAPLCGLTVYGKSTQNGTPSPDNPVPIVSAGDGGSITMKVTGKNLYHAAWTGNYSESGLLLTVTSTTIAIKGTATKDAYITQWLIRRDNPIPLDPNKRYTFTPKLTGNVFEGLMVYTYDEKGVGTYTGSNIPARSTGVSIYYQKNFKKDETIDFEASIQLEIGTEATVYEPYREQLLTLPTPNGLPGIPVTSGGNYTDPQGQQWVCDEVDLERGVKVQRIGKAGIERCIVSRDPNWWDASKSYSYQILTWKESFNTTIESGGPCNRFIAYTFIDFYSKGIENGFLISAGESVFNISKSLGICTTEEEFKTWFNENVALYKILATPIETPLTPAEIAAYKALITYAPNTVVQASDDAGIKLCYQRDVNLVVKNLEDAIASMTTT